MRAVIITLSAVLFLAACEGRQAVSICVASGDPAGQVTAAFHGADGIRALLFSDAERAESTLARDTLDEPIVPQLWLLAEPVMRALPSVEPSPCGDDPRSVVEVAFADGSTITRQTSCTGNALSRVANEVLGVSETTAAAARATPAGAALTTLAEACERLP
jgi:hypothetical protein